MTLAKEIYKMFEAVDDGGSELEFEFYLAMKLGMTVEEMCEKMSNLEFRKWAIFLGRKKQQRELAAKAGKILLGD